VWITTRGVRQLAVKVPVQLVQVVSSALAKGTPRKGQ